MEVETPAIRFSPMTWKGNHKVPDPKESGSMHNYVVSTICGEDERPMREMLMVCYKAQTHHNSVTEMDSKRLIVPAVPLYVTDF